MLSRAVVLAFGCLVSRGCRKAKETCDRDLRILERLALTLVLLGATCSGIVLSDGIVGGCMGL